MGFRTIKRPLLFVVAKLMCVTVLSGIWRLTVIFWATEKPGDSQLLQLMRMGARDIWLASESASDWLPRLQWLTKLNRGIHAVPGDFQRDIETARLIQQGMLFSRRCGGKRLSVLASCLALGYVER